MPFAAKSSPPNPAFCTYRHPTLIRAAHQHRAVFTCLPGYLDTECMLAELLQQGRQVLWLRLEPEDGDPATFILSLLQAVRVQKPDLGTDLIDHMHRSPGPIRGWPPLYHHMAQILNEALGENGMLVFEHVHLLSPLQPTLGLVSTHLLPNLHESNGCNMISHGHLPAAALPGLTHPITEKDLRFTSQVGIHLAEELGLCLPERIIKKAIHLLDGSVGALKALNAACDMFGSDYLQDVIRQGHNTSYILTIILSRWLTTFSEEEIQRLALCCKIQYTHPDLFTGESKEEVPLNYPWKQPLTGGWQRIRCLWEAPLRSALRNRAYIDYRLAQRLAQRLAEIGAIEQSIRLSCELNDYHAAAETIAAHADQWMDLGQWAMLENWIKQLPESELMARPQLLYVGGEIAAVQGRVKEAQRALAISSELLAAKGELGRACQSLLAQSTISAWENNLDQAKAWARLTETLAQRQGLDLLRGWAFWILGYLNVRSGDLDAAIAYFSKASENISPPYMANLLKEVETLTLKQHQIQKQEEFHLQSLLTIQQDERDIADRLTLIMHTLPENLTSLVDNLGWSNVPLMLKLSIPDPGEQPQLKEKSGFWQFLLNGLMNRRLPAKSEIDQMRESSLSTTSLPKTTNTNYANDLQELPNVNLLLSISNESPEASTNKPKSNLVLTAYLLGDFRASINDQLVGGWSGNRGLALFKYLLTNKNKEIPRDVLMDVFWPDANPEAARNNLNVTFYKLRQVLGTLSNEPVVIYDRGSYRLNTKFQVWTDIDEFERHVRVGKQLEIDGQISTAVSEYEVATSLYQGDFLSEDLYEDWAVSTRERLRVMFLETQDRLSQIYFNQGQYTACITLCQRILEYDNCREDAYRRLMRCFSRQGQQNLALRQYQVCVESLRKELDVEPEEATVKLSQLIRWHERV